MLKNKSHKYWSGRVTKESNALDLEEGVFTRENPEEIAESLKRSAEESTRRKGTPYQSAMSMLNFYPPSRSRESGGGISQSRASFF